jgi:site-specific DNA-adenine methylase
MSRRHIKSTKRKISSKNPAQKTRRAQNALGIAINNLTGGNRLENNKLYDEVEQLKKSVIECKENTVIRYGREPLNERKNEKKDIKKDRYGPNDGRSIFQYPGSKAGIKTQVVPPISELFFKTGSKRHIEGFLGGAGSFMAFPPKMTKNSIAIEFKPDVFRAHKGFVRKNGLSPIEKCANENYFVNNKIGSKEVYDERVQNSEQDSCVALHTAASLQVQNYTKKQEDDFLKKFNSSGFGKTIRSFKNQADIYSRDGVKVINASFLDYLDGNLTDKSKEIPGTVSPQKGDFLYLDPPYLGTEGVYGKDCLNQESTSSCSIESENDVQEDDQSEESADEEQGEKVKKSCKFVVPQNYKTCGDVPGDKDHGFSHRQFYNKLSSLYEGMRSEQPGNGINIALSHSIEGRFHCLFKNAFEPAIARGDVKACRIRVGRKSGKTVSFYDLAAQDTLKEQEWVMLISPMAKDIQCDSVDLSEVNKDEDQRVLDEIKEFEKNRRTCRVALGKAFYKQKTNGMSPQQKANFLIKGAGCKLPPSKESTPAWVKKEEPEVFEILQKYKKDEEQRLNIKRAAQNKPRSKKKGSKK